MSDFYLLCDGQPVKIDDPGQWAMFNEGNPEDRRVGYTELEDDVYVSTVFLSMDHNWSKSGPPILWETMIFGGKADGYQERYTSQEDAVRGHERAVRVAKGEIDPEENANVNT